MFWKSVWSKYLRNAGPSVSGGLVHLRVSPSASTYRVLLNMNVPPQTAGVRCGEETRQRWRNGHESVRGPTGNPLGQAEQRMHAAGTGIEQAIVVDLEDALGIGDLGRDLEAVLPVRKQAVTVGGNQLPRRLRRVGPDLAGPVHFLEHRL